MRLPEISFCGSCGPVELHSCNDSLLTALLLTFTFGQKGKCRSEEGCGQIWGRSSWMNTVDKSKKKNKTKQKEARTTPR